MSESPAVRTVRLLVSDVDTTNEILTDEQYGQLLQLEGDNVKLAAAQALDAIASSEVLVSKVIKTQDLSTDGAKTAAALREHADRLRSQAAAAADADDEGYFEIVDVIGTPSSPELTSHWTL